MTREQAICERFQKDGGYYHHMVRLVDALREVLEDGKDKTICRNV